MRRAMFCAFLSLAAAAQPQVKLQPVLPSATIQYPEGMFDYPRLSVNVAIKDGGVEIVGLLPKAPHPNQTSTPTACSDGSSECRTITVAMPKDAVASGKLQYWARTSGAQTWVELKTPRKLMVLDANRMFHDTGARPGEYEEFEGFSVQPTFLTWNCAVEKGNVTEWIVGAWHPSTAVEFKLRVPFKVCGAVETDEDDASD